MCVGAVGTGARGGAGAFAMGIGGASKAGVAGDGKIEAVDTAAGRTAFGVAGNKPSFCVPSYWLWESQSGGREDGDDGRGGEVHFG